MYASVWIFLYSLLWEFWLEEILIGNGNTLGIYIKSSEETRQKRYISYARICVYMNISKAILGSLTLEYRDEEWLQTIDYEHIPFRCIKRHEQRHLFRDFHLNLPQCSTKEDYNKQKEGFTQVQGRKRPNTRKLGPGQGKKDSTSNSFNILSKLIDTEEVENPRT